MVVAGRIGRGAALQVLRQVGEAVSAGPDFEARTKVSSAEAGRIRNHQKVIYQGAE
jgi:hypothetical protein